jgi:DNA polymerase
VKELLRRYLQERVELGESEIVLEHLTREEAVRLARGLGSEAASVRSTPVRGGPSGIREKPSPVMASAAVKGRAGRGAPVAEPAVGAEELARLACGAGESEILALPDLETLRAVAERCTRCPLHETRTNVVFGEGDPGAQVVCVGEAPGANEDETGRPFVGRAGQLMDRLLAAVGFPRSAVYICNVLKSRPPNNRDPLPDEVAACAPFLWRQLELIDPVVIVAFGAFAARTLLGRKDSLGRMRNQVHAFRGRPVVVTYHPAALLRNPGWTRPTWEDLQRVRRIVDGLEPVSGITEKETAASPEPTAPGANDAPEPEVQGGLFG